MESQYEQKLLNTVNNPKVILKKPTQNNNARTPHLYTGRELLFDNQLIFNSEFITSKGTNNSLKTLCGFKTALEQIITEYNPTTKEIIKKDNTLYHIEKSNHVRWMHSYQLAKTMRNGYEDLRDRCLRKDGIKLSEVMKTIYEKSNHKYSIFVLLICRNWKCRTKMTNDFCAPQFSRENSNNSKSFVETKEMLRTQIDTRNPNWKELNQEDILEEYLAYKEKQNKEKKKQEQKQKQNPNVKGPKKGNNTSIKGKLTTKIKCSDYNNQPAKCIHQTNNQCYIRYKKGRKKCVKRLSPTKKANEFKLGKKMIGMDGKMWIVKKRERTVLIPKGDKSGKKKTKKVKISYWAREKTKN